MDDLFLGTILPVAFDFAPEGWEFCDGRTLPKDKKYEPLFKLIGDTYGADANYFRLPDLCGRFPIGLGLSMAGGTPLPGLKLGEKGGSPTASVGIENLPSHTHAGTVSVNNDHIATLKVCTDKATASVPSGQMLPAALNASDPNGGGAPNIYGYAAASANVINVPAISLEHVNMTIKNETTGNNEKLGVMNPYIALRYIIKVVGPWPPPKDRH